MEQTGLENELLQTTTEALPYEEETYNGNRDYDPGPNDGKYGFVEVEVDGKIRKCTNAYTSKSYGGQYCVGDSYEDPNGGTQVIRSINPTGLDLAPAQWDAEATYADAGEQMGMSLDQWTEFSSEIQALNETVDGLKGNMFGPTEQERGRLGIRISQENPDFTEEQVMAEADRLLEEKWTTSEAYAEAAAAETALFNKYGIRKENDSVYGSGVFVDDEGKYHKFESSSGNYYQTSQDTSFLDVAVPVGISIITGVITGGAGQALTGALANAGLSPALAQAASSAILNSAAQMITTGEVDITQALTSAAGAYFQEAGLSGLLGDSGVSSTLGDLADTVTGKMNEFKDLISTGSTIADAAIQAGGMSMLTSLVTQGEIDVQQALIAAAQAGGTNAIGELIASGAATDGDVDEFEEWLAQDEEMQQQFIDADVKDPFLNPNYTTIGDGLMQNADGEVFNYDGDSIGNMSDLDVDGDGVLNANDLEFVEATGEYRSIPQDVQDALDPPINETPALQLQDGNTYYLDVDGNVYSGDQVEWRGGDTNDYVVIGTDTVAGTTATYSQGSDVFYDDDMKIVLRGEDAGIINIGTGNEFTYGEQYSGNQIFDDVSGIPDDLGAAQYSGTVRGAPGDPGAEFDVYYNPETNTTYLVNKADPTKVNKIEDTTPEEVEQQQEPESDPVDSTDENLTGGEDGGGDDGSANENPYEEDTNVDDEVVDSTEDATTTNPLLKDDDSANDTTDPTPSTEETTEETEETTEETGDSEVVDSNGEVVVETGSSNPTHRTDQVTGLLGGLLGSVSGQGGDTTETGTEDGTEDGDADDPDGTTIGEDATEDSTGGDDATATGPGDDDTGTGDPGVDDGTGGGGGGGDGNGNGDGQSDGTEWSELFRYTTVKNPSLSKYAPTIAKVKGMFDAIS